MIRIPLATRVFVARRAHFRCEYCRSSEQCTGQDFTLDHVISLFDGGSDSPDNLCWSCFWCNSFKQARHEAVDPRSGLKVPLFNPRCDEWDTHFRWSRLKFSVVARTEIGRATIAALRLNRPTLVRARRIWVRQGLHPR